MKRAIAFSSVLFLLACGDVPTEVPLDVQPEFATVIGDGATWCFEGVIYSAADPSLIGQTVQGSIAFTIWTDDVLPERPCVVYRYVESVATYTGDGQEFTLSDADGQALTYMSCA